MKSNISHNIKQRKKPKDKFYTPKKLARVLINLVPLKEGDLVLDCCLGKGAFFDNYPSNVSKEYCEIDLGIDFLETRFKPDWIVSNPPYSKIDDWLKKSCQISKIGFAYLLGIDNLTARRIQMCNRYGFGLTKFHLFKVFKWFGMSCFVIFQKNKKNIITYNRKVWRQDKSEETFKDADSYKKLDSFMR